MADEVRGVSAEEIRPFIDWLDSEQAPDTYVTQFGVTGRAGDFSIGVMPGGPAQHSRRAPGGCVLVFKIHPDVAQYGPERPQGRELTNGIDPELRDELEAVVTEVVPVHSAWNGVGKACVSCSFHIAKDAGPGVAGAYKRWSGRDGIGTPWGLTFVTGLNGEKRS